MKAQQRHRLKEDAFALNTMRVVESFNAHRDRWIAGGLAVVVVIAGVAGFTVWRRHAREAGGAVIGVALAIEQAQIAPAPTVPGASQAAGTYPTEQARSEAALKAFQQIAAMYGSASAGITAEYHVGINDLALGRFADAQQAFQQTAAEAGDSIYAPMAKMGEAEALLAAGRYDDAIKAFTGLSAQRDGPLPVDGVLMQLAGAYVKAGKTAEARATYQRVLDEFSDSPYAQDARQQLAGLG